MEGIVNTPVLVSFNSLSSSARPEVAISVPGILALRCVDEIF